MIFKLDEIVVERKSTLIGFHANVGKVKVKSKS